MKSNHYIDLPTIWKLLTPTHICRFETMETQIIQKTLHENNNLWPTLCCYFWGPALTGGDTKK